MKEKRLLDALEGIDDRYIHDIYEEARPKNKKKLLPWLAAAACVCVALLATLPFLSFGTPDDSPSTAQPEELPLLSSAITFAPMGYEGHCLYDTAALNSQNPWQEERGPATLPVYENLAYSDGSGAPVYLSKEVMTALAEETAASLDTGILSTQWDYHRDTAYCLTAETVLGTLKVFGGGSVSFQFSQPLTLPEEYRFTPAAETAAQAEAALYYLAGTYPQWIGLQEPVAEVTASYNFYGAYNNSSYLLYEGSGDLTQQILSYNFSRYSFHFTEEGSLQGFYRENDLSYSAEQIGEYPLIDAQTARELLLAGSFFSSVPQSELKADSLRSEDIVKVELIYRSGNLSETYLPYYCFHVELKGSGIQAEGLKEVGLFYVPAVEGIYLTDLPLYDGNFPG